MPNVKNVTLSHEICTAWNSTDETIETMNETKTNDATEMMHTILANTAFLALKAAKNKIEYTRAAIAKGDGPIDALPIFPAT